MMSRCSNPLRESKNRMDGCWNGRAVGWRKYPFIHPSFHTIILLLLFVLILSGCSTGTPDNREGLLVAAAASLKEVMTDIGNAFTTRYGTPVIFNFSGSNLLQRQIEAGAPADLFASAAAIQMDTLAARHLIIQETRTTFATNTIVLVVPEDRPQLIHTFDDLSDDRINRIAIGGEGVPIRVYSEEVLRHIGLWDTLSSKYIFGGNTRQVLEYVARGETDAGLVYRTDALIRSNIQVVAEADSSWHRPIAYPIAVVTDSRQQTAARQFIAFVMSEAGREIVRQHGFGR